MWRLIMTFPLILLVTCKSRQSLPAFQEERDILIFALPTDTAYSNIRFRQGNISVRLKRVNFIFADSINLEQWKKALKAKVN